MNKTGSVVCFFAFVGAWPIWSMSAEYQGSDFLPEIRYLVFDRDAVGFVSHESRSVDSFGSAVFHFTYDRGNRRVVEVDAGQFQRRFPASTPRTDPRPDPSQTYDLIGHARGGVEYKLKMKYCGEGVTDDIRKVVVANRNVRVRSRHECTSVSSVEIIDGQLWLGTAYSGEAGYSAAEGVIVQDMKGATVLARITALSGPVARIQADPVSNNLWVITSDGIYEISRQHKILSVNLSYQDFDPATGQPRYFFARKAAHGNPLAVVSRWLPVADRKKFYEAVSTIPAADVERFSLYEFHMCCDSSMPGYPASFRILAPFFIRAISMLKDGESPNIYRQAACRMGGPETAQYCARAQ